MANKSNISIDFIIINSYASIAAIPLFAVGFLTNLFIFYVMIKFAYFHKITYNLIRVSVVSDIIITLIASFGYLLFIAVDFKYETGRLLCRILVYIVLVSYGTSILTLCLISVDRYFVTVKSSIRYYQTHRTKIVLIGQIMIVTIAMSVCAPILILMDTYPDQPKFCDFIKVNTATSIYFILSTVWLFIIPSSILAYTYWKIIDYLKNHVRPGKVTIEKKQEEEFKKSKQVKVLVYFTTSLLLLTWPYFATSLGIAFTQKSLRKLFHENCSYYFLAFLSYDITTGISVINPYLYLKFDTNIRNKSYDLIRKLLLKQNNRKIQVVAHNPNLQTTAVNFRLQ
ncbi:5-hydroxytryptamine receptor 5B [Trichoplax sp. H2]|nr:5-hydroxytryptamine receptor 5B [Trichoplax sp. H2]|eukprot:RDD42324.1 5-hydroxytryptamine receptor 5B [Trichoplax sp. H2]